MSLINSSNTNLKWFQEPRGNYANIEPWLEKLAAAKVTVDVVLGGITEAQWVAILVNMPVVLFPRFLVDPEFILKQQYPKLFEEEQI